MTRKIIVTLLHCLPRNCAPRGRGRHSGIPHVVSHRPRRETSILWGYIVTLLVIGVVAQSYRTSVSWAQTLEATDDATLDKINLIKEKVASKVAQLQKVVQFAADGGITEIEEDILTFSVDGEEKTVTADDETRYLSRNSRLQTATAKQSDLAVNDKVTILGSEQIGTDLVTAKLIVKTPPVVFFTGLIEEVDSGKGTFTIKEKDSKYIFDYEVYTQSMLLNSATEKLEAAGFSKLKKGRQLQILAVPQQDSETTFTALRLVIIP